MGQYHATMRGRRIFALAALLILAALAIYGFLHERLFAQQMWTPIGSRRFLLYSLLFTLTSGCLLIWVPRWLGVVAAGFVLIYTIWWSGPAAPLAVLYFLGGCFLTGRILARRADAASALLLGLTVWMLAIWIALHFPINTRVVYAVALAVPYLWEARRFRDHLRGVNLLCASRAEAAGLALLLFVLMAHWLIALKPEVSDDGLSMHLALPMAVAHDKIWAFDFRQYTWSLMPAGGDSLFTAAYVLAGPQGGETAARLTNFALLVLLAAMVARASRQWLSPERAFVAAALFVSTPLVQLVTGSLFVENVWAALLLGACLALAKYVEKETPADLRLAGVLFGGALAVKLIAAVYLAPAAAIAIWIAARRRNLRPLVSAALLLAVFAAPPYLYALVKSGNPVFPFANALFRSPYVDTAASFADPRFVTPLSWRAPYDATFRSGRFFEGQGGGAGFQYFLLLIPAAILERRRSVRFLIAVGGMAALALFAFLPNLRYCYPALPLFSIALSSLFAESPILWTAVALTAVNAAFLPASGWYQNDFAPFQPSEVASTIEASAPERRLIEHLNRTAPGQPVAFFGSDAVAGLHAPAYTNTWHTYPYWRSLGSARKSADVARILRERNIRYILAPTSVATGVLPIDSFLRDWAEPPSITCGRMGLFKVRAAPVETHREFQPFPPGAWDDLDERIDYIGAWVHDRQFAQPLEGSLTYSAEPGDSFRLFFTGSAVTYIFTKALNRGTAAVLVDGMERARIDMYSASIAWRSQWVFDHLSDHLGDHPGTRRHTLEVRVLEQKNPASSGTYVDLDGIVVAP